MRSKTLGVVVALLVATAAQVLLPGQAVAAPTCSTVQVGESFSVQCTEGTGGGSNPGGGNSSPGGGYNNNDVAPSGPTACELATAAGNLCQATEPTHRMAQQNTPPVNPLAVAQSVATGMQIQPIEIGMAPHLAKSGVQPPVGLIGLPIWWWVANPGENTIGPLTRTATVGAMTVNVTAVNTGIMFAMTDGGPPIPCAAHATIPYTDLFLGMPSPACGRPTGAIRTSIHDPGGVFTVTATSLWIITWSAWTGPTPVAGGTFPMTPTATEQVRFGEVQVLTGGG